MSDWSLHAARIAPLPTEPDPCASCGNPHDDYPGPRGRLCRRCYRRAGDEPTRTPRLSVDRLRTELVGRAWVTWWETVPVGPIPPLPPRLAAVISRGEHRP